MQLIEIKDECYFLSPYEEEQIKLEYEKEKAAGRIDIGIIPILDNLNSIDGVATLYSCQGHLDKPRSYLVMKISEEMVYPFTESVWDLIKEHNNLTVDWESRVNYRIDNKIVSHETTIIRGSMNYNYMVNLFNKLK